MQHGSIHRFYVAAALVICITYRLDCACDMGRSDIRIGPTPLPCFFSAFTQFAALFFILPITL